MKKKEQDRILQEAKKGPLIHYNFLLKKSTRIVPTERSDDPKIIPRKMEGKQGKNKILKVTKIV